MKKIYLLLLVTVLAFAGTQKTAYAGSSVCPTIDAWDVLNPTDAIYPYGIVTGTYSGFNVLSGDLYYEGSFLTLYESTDGSIFLFDLNPGNYEFIYCGGSIPFTVTGIACDISLLNIGTTDVSGAGCTPNGVIDLTATSSTIGATYYYNLTDLSTFVEYTGQDDGFGIISITGLSAGTYALFISTEPDVLNSTCNYNQLVTINEPSCDMAIPTSSAADATTQGGTDGTLSVSVTGASCIPTAPGGNPVYNVYAELNSTFYADLVFNPNNGNYELSGLMAGTYTVIANNGGTTCFASVDLTVGEPGCNLPSPAINATNTTICNGSPAILGVPSGYDSYQWVYNGSFLITTGLTGTDPVYWAYLEGNYSCIVTYNGCTAVSNSVFVSAPLSPEINFPDTIYSCDNSVTLTAPPAFSSYLWSTLETTASVTLTTDGWYGLAAGVDALACGVVDSFYVSLNNTAPTVSIDVVGANPFCVGSSINLVAVADPNPVLWSTNETSQSIVVSTTGNYSVEVTNTIGCTATASVTVTAQTCVPATQLSNGVCGYLSFVRTSAISCVTVAGATQYEWEFSNGNGVYATKLSPLNYIALHNVTPTLNWGTTWSLRVRAIIGSNAGVFSSPCTIGIIADPAISGVPETQLRSQDCGKLNYRINTANRIITLPVPGAVQYEFEFSNVTTGAVVATALRQFNVVFLNTVTPSLPFPAQYNVRTRARLVQHGVLLDRFV